MRPVDVVTQLWERIDARDWPGMERLVAADVVVEWPVSGERIVGRANFVAVQSEYPEGWSIRVLRIVAQGEQEPGRPAEVVSEVEVPHTELGIFRAASFWTVHDGRITAATEYWTDLYGEQPPVWRQELTEAM
ncbi:MULTISPECIES: nuclear transport factor 2 family protein [unclassified Streptomyces]|uniref:nuclear transport factor 2 family protein n=1 Tax=unclassified Streptomyces TaxID=2593676 RepID=UPI002DDB2734|nr:MULTISPECIES: nuclear transport factor 2 family protein [unclassified Streptomyces]WSB76928.1 nuclear transport factor 2 family protein [Streptomyces sp. NBC_01775]WSS14799.1 nuclear transport factor 2 family protein [Streptomyces sp. NBC_01186]WSS43633.1 nuclear transport factor 2 family protein [Streptomyces sp. NBC_01187]